MNLKFILILIWFANPTTKLPNHDENNFFNLIKEDFYHKTFSIITEDGYILKLFRISKSKNFNKKPILLLHGILDSSDSFFVN